MFEGFEVSGGQINPDLLDFSYPPYFPVEFFLGSEHGSYHMGTGIQKSRPADQLRPRRTHVPCPNIYTKPLNPRETSFCDLLCTWLKLQVDSFFVVFSLAPFFAPIFSYYRRFCNICGNLWVNHPLEINWVCTLRFWPFLDNVKFHESQFVQLADSWETSVHIGSSSCSWTVDSFLAPIFSCSILRIQAFTQAWL